MAAHTRTETIRSSMRAAALVVVATACGEVTAPVAEECAFIADGLCWVDLEFGHEVTAVASTPWGVVVGTGGHGVHRFDAGRWHAMGLEGVTVSSLLFVPGDLPMLLAGLEWRMEAMPGSTLLATTDPEGDSHPRDGGLSYFAQEEWWRSVPVLAADPADPSRLFWGGHGFTALSADAGLTWDFVAGDGRPTLGQETHAVAVAPEGDPRLWLGKEPGMRCGGMVSRSEDGGETWSWTWVDPRIEGSARGPNAVFSILLDPLHPDRLWACMSSWVVRSDDGGETWDPLLWEYQTFAALVWFQGAVHALTSYGGPSEPGGRSLGMLRASDGGSDWQPVAVPPQIVADGPLRPWVFATTDEEGRLLVGSGSGLWRVEPDRAG
jgi:hypothetical protein